MITLYRTYPVIPLVVLFSIITMGTLIDTIEIWMIVLCLCVNLAWAALSIVIFYPIDTKLALRIVLVITLCFSTWLQLILIQRSTLLSLPFPLQKIVAIEGEVLFDSTISEKGNSVIQLALKTASNRYEDTGLASGSLLVVVDACEALLAGHRITLTGTCITLEDSHLFLAEEYQIIEEPSRLLQVRGNILSFLTTRLAQVPKESEILAKALLIGRFEAWSPIRELTTQSGCAHILALSGMHLHAIVGLLTYILKRFLSKRKTSYIALAFAVCYVIIVGNKPSLVRALIMLLVCQCFTRFSGRDALFIVIIGHTWVAPSTIFTVGTVLSYGALCGIYFLAPIIIKYCSPYVPNLWAQIMGTTVGASLATAPYSLLLFDAWYVIGIVLSPLLAPIALVVLFCAIIYIIYPLTICTMIIGTLTSCFLSIIGWGSSVSRMYPQCNTVSAYLVCLGVLLTAIGFLKYASQIDHRRRCRHYEMGFSLRFPPSNHPIA